MGVYLPQGRQKSSSSPYEISKTLKRSSTQSFSDIRSHKIVSFSVGTHYLSKSVSVNANSLVVASGFLYGYGDNAETSGTLNLIIDGSVVDSLDLSTITMKDKNTALVVKGSKLISTPKTVTVKLELNLSGARISCLVLGATVHEPWALSIVVVGCG